MKPTLQILYKYDYAKKLYQGQESFEDVWLKILALGADFEKVMREYIGVVLDSIEKYSGFAWTEFCEPQLPVYLIEAEKSLSHPLSLAVSDDPKEMLEDFIFQLSCRNMLFGFTNEELRQECLQSVTDHVMMDLNLKEEPQGQLDLKKQTIKKYLGK